MRQAWLSFDKRRDLSAHLNSPRLAKTALACQSGTMSGPACQQDEGRLSQVHRNYVLARLVIAQTACVEDDSQWIGSDDACGEDVDLHEAVEACVTASCPHFPLGWWVSDRVRGSYRERQRSIQQRPGMAMPRDSSVATIYVTRHGR